MRLRTVFAPLWRWGLLLAAGVLVLLVWQVDRQLKRAPSPGYTVSAAMLSAEFGDFPAYWDRLRDTPAGQAAEAELARPLHFLALDFYRATGIRPTPSRAAAWLGRRWVLSVGGEGWLLSLRPGLLLRAAHALHALRSPSAVGGIYTYRDLYYRWETGYLLVSASLEALQDVVPIGPAPAPPPDRMALRLAGVVEGSVTAAPGIPLEILLPATAPPRDLAAPPAPPGDAAVALRVADAAQLRALVRALLPLTEQLGVRWSGWTPARLAAMVPAPLRQTRGPAAFALVDVVRRGGLPVPQLAAAWQRTAVPELVARLDDWALAAGLARIARPGGGTDDALYPIWGAEWSLVTATVGEHLVLATAPEVVDRWPVEAVPWPRGTVAQAQVNWERCAERLRVVAHWLAESGYWPGLDTRAADGLYGPWLRFLQQLGDLRIDVRGEGGQIRITGTLSAVQEIGP